MINDQEVLEKEVESEDSTASRVKTAQLVREVADDVGMYQKDVKEVVEALLARLERHVAAGEQVVLYGFGSFSRSRRKARTYQVPGSKRTVYREGNWTVRFTPGTPFRDAIND